MQLLLGSELGSSEISEKMSELEKINSESSVNQDNKEETKEIKKEVEDGDSTVPDISIESDIQNKLDDNAAKEPEGPSQSMVLSIKDESSINLDDGDEIDITDMSKLTNGVDLLEKNSIDLEGMSDGVLTDSVEAEKKIPDEGKATKDQKDSETFDTINLIDDNNEVKADDSKNDDVVDLDSYNSDNNTSTKNDIETCPIKSVKSNETEVMEIVEDKTLTSEEAVTIQESEQVITETKSTDKVDTINLTEEGVQVSDIANKSTIDVVDLDIGSPEKVTTEDDIPKLKVEQDKTENHVNVEENISEPKEKKVVGENDNHNVSNTLDITSDDDDSATKSKTGKSCVTIEDDDDIMVIDEVAEKNKESSGDKVNDEPVKKVAAESTSDVEMKSESVDLDEDVVMSTEVSDIVLGKEKEEDILMPPKDKEIEEKVNGIEKSVKQNNITKDKPLVPLNFIKSFKTTLKDMTRDDLEEFCLLKIVEGVVERSNMSEIKSKLKTLQQNVDDWRRKAMLLSKQHRDLQLVLKTVKEEQKKRLDEIVTPLKITRSVGLQLSRVDLSSTGVRTIIPTKHKSAVLRAEQDGKTDLNSPNSKVEKPSSNLKQDKPTPSPTSPRSTYNPPPLVPIPVPRLVPASAAAAAANSFPKTGPRPTPQVQNPTVSSNGMANANKPPPTPNGLRKVPSPAQAPAKIAPKRTFNNIQSIDLTDDEPPSKQFVTISKFQNQRPQPRSNVVHNAPRMTYAVNPTSMNAPSPRQVYIPISGQPNQNTMRPGQTIMFKTVGNPGMQGNRMRNPQPSGLAKPGPVANNVVPYRNNQRQTAQSFHPAPLPHVFKQQQSPNRKWLPPAPELKISKVDNGIVISWIMEGYVEGRFEEIASYQIYAYQETSAPPSTSLWKKIGDVKALPLPMACTLTQFMAGYKYYFAVRAVDVTSRVGPFSLPGSILLINKK